MYKIVSQHIQFLQDFVHLNNVPVIHAYGVMYESQLNLDTKASHIKLNICLYEGRSIIASPKNAWKDREMGWGV